MSKESGKELGKSTPKQKESDSKKQQSEKKTDDTAKAADTPAGEEGKQKADVINPLLSHRFLLFFLFYTANQQRRACK